MREIIIGERFSRLVVISGPFKIDGCLRFVCACDCGNETKPQGHQLLSGKTKSCGCLSRDLASQRAVLRNTKHGMKKSPEYAIWSSMIQRCCNPKCHAYKNYGARGIFVCERWKSGFALFLEDVGYRPSDGMTFDRINNHSGYEPGNVRWVPMKTQARNKRTNTIIECFGESKTLCEWAESTGIHRCQITQRIKLGWTTEKALTTPVRKKSKISNKGVDRVCVGCGETRKVYPGKRKISGLCSLCFNSSRTGDLNPNWKGGNKKSLNKNSETSGPIEDSPARKKSVVLTNL